jgi:hypothetical protein
MGVLNVVRKDWAWLSVMIVMIAAYAPPARAQSISTGYVTITSMGCNMVSGNAGTAC